jgi:hypothetical protein
MGVVRAGSAAEQSMNSRLWFSVVAGLLLFSTGASAQSLADVARQEQARRKTIKHPGKTYTNKDLRGDTGSASIPAEEASSGPGEPAAAGAGSTASTPKPGEPPALQEQPSPVKDEAYWRDRIASARAALDQTQVLLDALQSRINALTADFTARDDPAQRAVIARDRERALAELARLQDDLETKTQAVSDIEEEARRAGVPPGWLR